MAVAPHIHISGIGAIIQALYVIVILGALKLIARRFTGHPFADAVNDLY